MPTSQPEAKPRPDCPGGVVEFVCDSDTFEVTQEMQDVFDWDGIFLVRNLLNKAELDKIWKVVLGGESLENRAWDLSDGKGGSCRLLIWNQPGDDVTGMVARSEKVAGTSEKLLGGEVYHYHSKVMFKDAKIAGNTLWHQDYGYWYKNGNLRPDLMSCFIALDPCNRHNGGLQNLLDLTSTGQTERPMERTMKAQKANLHVEIRQIRLMAEIIPSDCKTVLKGTHRCGRIDHDLIHGQTVANQERIDQLSKHFEHVYADLNPGDALFFHCNLLHTSDKNESDQRRWAMICCYNRADNDPVYKHHHASYTPLHKVPNSAILECTNFTDFSGKEFMDPAGDKTTRATMVSAGKQ